MAETHRHTDRHYDCYNPLPTLRWRGLIRAYLAILLQYAIIAMPHCNEPPTLIILFMHAHCMESLRRGFCTSMPFIYLRLECTAGVVVHVATIHVH